MLSGGNPHNERTSSPIAMLSVALFVFVGWIVSVCLHEFGHAIVAYWGGDTSVKDKGYLTLNPLKYTDVSLSLVMPLIFLLLGGIPLPGAAVYINQHQLRGRIWKSAVSLAGPAMTGLTAIALSLPFLLGYAPTQPTHWIWPALAFLALLEIAGVILNLLPVPSLDGYGILEPWLPESWQNALNRYSKYGVFVLFGLLWFSPQANLAFWSSVMGIADSLRIPADLAWEGHDLFKDWAAGILVALIVVWAIAQRLFPSKPSWQQDRKTAVPFMKAMEQGDQLIQENRFDEAIAAFDQASQILPDRYEPWYGRTIALMLSERFDEALQAADRAIELQPDFYGAWHYRGLVLRNLGQPDQAIAAYDEALKLKPRDPKLMSDRGVALIEAGQYEEAITAYSQLLKLQPSSALAFYNLACSHALKGETEPALKALQKAVNLEDGYGAIAKHDSDLEAIRGLEEFGVIVDR